MTEPATATSSLPSRFRFVRYETLGHDGSASRFLVEAASKCRDDVAKVAEPKPGSGQSLELAECPAGIKQKARCGPLRVAYAPSSESSSL